MHVPGTYNGGLTREQFLFFETRIVAKLICEGLTVEEAFVRIREENLFQFPTEKMIGNLTRVCYRRVEGLQGSILVENLAEGPIEVAKLITLYGIMRDNRLVYDFMVSVIGEKFRTQDFELTTKEMNEFFTRLQEQNDKAATWSENTINKLKQVLRKCLVECGYLNSFRSTRLNPIFLFDELEQGIRENCDYAVFPAFNYFEKET